MTAPFLRIVEPGVVSSWALEDESEAEFRDVLALLNRLTLPAGSPGGRQLSCDVQVIETWLRSLKAAREQLASRTSDIEAERHRLRDEITEFRRREAWDPGSLRLRVQLEEALHCLTQDLFKLQESFHRSETEAKKFLLEAYARINNQFASQTLPAVSALLAFLECGPARSVLVLHDPEPLDQAVPERIP